MSGRRVARTRIPRLILRSGVPSSHGCGNQLFARSSRWYEGCVKPVPGVNSEEVQRSAQEANRLAPDLRGRHALHPDPFLRVSRPEDQAWGTDPRDRDRSREGPPRGHPGKREEGVGSLRRPLHPLAQVHPGLRAACAVRRRLRAQSPDDVQRDQQACFLRHARATRRQGAPRRS